MANKIYYLGTNSFLKKNGIAENQISELPNNLELNKNIIILSLSTAKTIEEILSFPRTIRNSNFIGNFLGCNEEMAKILLDKNLTKTFLSKLGFNTTKGFSCFGEINLIKNIINKYNLHFPILIKELNNHSGQGIYPINSLQELNNLKLNLDLEYLVEEFIQGDEYSVMLFINNGKTVVFPPIFKGPTKILDNGKILHALLKNRSNIVDKNIDEKIRKISTDLGKIKGINGFIEIETIFDKKDGNLKIIEINPRISGTTEISFLSTNYSFTKLLNDLSKKGDINQDEVFCENIVLEYPIVHNNPDFTEIKINIEGGKIIKNRCLRQHPPYIQKILIEFDDIDSYNNFIIKNENLNENKL